MKKITTQHMVKLALFIAASTVLYFFEFRILPGQVLKMDLSDVPVLVSGILLGPWTVPVVAFVKNVLHLLFMSSDGHFAGELANFMYIVLLGLPLTYLIKNKQRKKIPMWLYISLIVVVVVLSALIMNVLNYYITFPLYGMSRTGAWTYLNAVFLPFNLVKGGILSIITVLVYPKLRKL